MTITKNKAILLLEDGTIFKGFAVGKIGTTTGEICFSTGLTGYQELYTDPSFFGQILVQTFVHVGNYGVKDNEVESDNIQIAGLVCKSFASHYSRKMADKSLQDYFIEQGITGIEGVDTRAIVQHIREKGSMNAIISSEILDVNELKSRLAKVPSMAGLELSSKVSTHKFYTLGNESAPLRVAVIDYGVKKNILRNLVNRNVFCGIFPAKTEFEEIMKFKPDGIMLPNGPGDPGTMDYALKTVKKIMDSNIPTFGICMGNQLLGQAFGLKTFKMNNGHRGLNHPVKNIQNGICEITVQNHGFALKNEPNEMIEVTHVNLNDNTIEGIRIKGKPAYSVQYHPESAPGPHDSHYLFDDFISLMNTNKK
ncbi:MAG: glutamine-hydrolyzing carbamoyl-phosphate synthase small subunit [Bacteroidetes bacterium]|nr:glutamine-hydrolyzing carbamoyl-phosphate synthase small subunit [Bacteroidota bacterium]